MISKVFSVIPQELIIVYSMLFFLGVLSVFTGWYVLFYKRVLESYNKAELFRQAAIDTADIIFIRGDSGTVLFSNKAHASFLGYDHQYIVGRHSSEFYPQEICDIFDDIDKKVFVTREKLRFEITLHNRKGSMLDSEVTLSPCEYEDIKGVMYIIRDVHEQNRVTNALVKRDKLLYALTCGTQSVLDNSQDFDRALSRALEVFGKGADVDVVVLAEHVHTEVGEDSRHKHSSSYRVKTLWGRDDDLNKYKNEVFQIVSSGIRADNVIEQEKIVFIHVDQIEFSNPIDFTDSNLVGFYATTIFCQGVKWGVLLLACKDIKEKWDEESVDAIEISALQFGILLERRMVEESIETTVEVLKKSQKRLNMALKVAGAASFEYDIFLDKLDIDTTLYEKLEYDKNWSIDCLDELKAIIHKSDLPRWHDNVSALLSGELYHVTGDIRIRMSGGRYLWMTMIASATIEEGAIVGISGVFQDIDEKMLRESRLFNAEKMASIGELSTAIANKFNRVNREILKELTLLVSKYNSGEASDPKQLKNLIVALEDSILIADNLAALIPKDSKSIGMVGVNRLIENIVGMVRSDFGDSGIDIETSFDSDIPDILCRATDIMHTIANLMINAKQAMEFSNNKVLRIATSLDGDSILISIKDTGCGITLDKYESIFEPFYSVKNGQDNPDGTGLGLSVSRSLVKRAGGFIEVNSVPGEGSEFIIVLPTKSSAHLFDELIPLG